MNKIKKLFKFGGEDLDKRTASLISALGWFLLLFIWWLLPTAGWISPRMLPSPIAVFKAYKLMFFEQHLVANTGFSIALNLAGYLQALAVAIPLGFIIGLTPFFRHLISGPISSIRFTPLPATTGIFMAFFGLGLNVKVQFLAFGIFVYLLPAIIQRFKDIDTNPDLKVRKQTMWTLNAGNWDSIKHFYGPSVLSRFSPDVINLVAVSWTYIVIAEMLNAIGGVGYLIYLATSRGTHVDQLYAVILLIIFIGFISDKSLKAADRKLFPSKYA